ncbi:hypothetical protein CTRG_05932 [Candida tropicalis MYA-3404]|uniref:Zn(2)-C6 fungal-type domain-containing protein n=1 Tax=Candida tropicalis (strain ATCC MYA-3404 / T1) TaxID=294747 RepID=C5MIN9_CANTT|nr:hypothetical protein CTRG_05932 [Candida tropicalis MYA-3404]EER30533.1 hypothetical protein CTRG_05932 [Candida tropicalis MYA-3404]KAG4406397.1 hypothetical protein JTP64_003781 [Candida tropicalis]
MSSRRNRSKTGCKRCKERKRKCDETHPSCNFCLIRGLSCEYEIKIFDMTSFRVDKPKKNKNKNINKTITTVDIEVPSCTTITTTSTDIIRLPTPTDLHFPETTFSPTFNINASSPLILYLDDQGIQYIKIFERYANLVSLSEKTNYIKSTFLTLAFSNEAISNLLASWGATFQGDGEEAEKYLIQSKELVKSSPIDRFDYFTSVAYNLIQMAIYIHRGDTKNWYDIFKKCEKLVRDYGGLKKFIQDFGFSNDCKFLISNFQFYDVMSSESLANGTTCTMENYHNLFKGQKLLEGDYGLDPYQGCCQPIYLLLGEIMNVYVETKRERENVVHQKDSTIRVQFYKQVEQKVNYLITSINNCHPSSIPDENNDQLELFKLCCIAGKMYVLLYIKQTQPKSSEIQLLLLESIDIIDKLIETKLAKNLSMALLICGITAGNKSDRQNIESKFSVIYERYKQGNLKRIWEIVKESWIRNPYGSICIDWLDICHDFNWKISMI